MTTTLEAALRRAQQSLVSTSSSPRLDVEVLLAFVLSCTRIDLIKDANAELSDEQLRQFEALVHRRAQSVPVAYLIGKKDFWNLEFTVDERVLVPRPETEILVEECLKYVRSCRGSIDILELGVGSGCISVSVAHELQKHGRGFSIYALDVDPEALKVASLNAKKHGVADKIQFVHSDWFAGLEKGQKFDVILSNPPYVPAQAADMSAETKFEPAHALFAGEDGLDDVRYIIKNTPAWLRSGKGALICEFGARQTDDIAEYINSYRDSEALTLDYRFIKDLAGWDRILSVHFSSR